MANDDPCPMEDLLGVICAMNGKVDAACRRDDWHQGGRVRLCGEPTPRRPRHPTRSRIEPGIGSGRSAQTAKNVTRFNDTMVVCGLDSCRSLVRWNSVRTAARKAKRPRDAVEAHDACTGRAHLRYCKEPYPFVCHQLDRVAAVLRGEALVVRRPVSHSQEYAAALGATDAARALRCALDAALIEYPHATKLHPK